LGALHPERQRLSPLMPEWMKNKLLSRVTGLTAMMSPWWCNV